MASRSRDILLTTHRFWSGPSRNPLTIAATVSSPTEPKDSLHLALSSQQLRARGQPPLAGTSVADHRIFRQITVAQLDFITIFATFQDTYSHPA